LHAVLVPAVLAVLVAGCSGDESGEAEAMRGSEERVGTGAADERSSGGEGVLAVSDTTEAFRGTLLLGIELSVFRPCGSAEESWLMDRTGGNLGRSIRRLSPEQGRAVYVEILGRVEPPLEAGPGADFKSKLIAEEALYADADTTKCQGPAIELQ
jgi:hypothetical protein